jgi:hypothetical protein
VSITPPPRVDTTVHPALWPNAEDARARRLVRLPDGRVARLAFVRQRERQGVEPRRKVYVVVNGVHRLQDAPSDNN